jgi:hypothetical protein
MKKSYSSIFCILFLAISAFSYSQTKLDVGYYLTKDDYLNKKITIIERMQSSENFNVGTLIYKDKDAVEHKINCIKEKYWGFRYLDGFDYMYIDGFFGKIVLLGRINLVISPKASFKLDEKGDYTFTHSADGKINYYFMKNLDASTIAPFDKLIADEKQVLKDFQADRDNYGEFINKQMKYLKIYNAVVPKAKKGAKK